MKTGKTQYAWWRTTGEIASSHDYWTTNAFGWLRIKNPIELSKVEKYLKNLFSRGQGGIGSESYERKNIKETWFKETVLNSLQNLPQQAFFYASVDIYPSVTSIKEHSQRKPQLLSSGRKCSLLQLIGFGIHNPDPFLTLPSQKLDEKVFLFNGLFHIR